MGFYIVDGPGGWRTLKCWRLGEQRCCVSQHWHRRLAPTVSCYVKDPSAGSAV